MGTNTLPTTADQHDEKGGPGEGSSPESSGNLQTQVNNGKNAASPTETVNRADQEVAHIPVSLLAGFCCIIYSLLIVELLILSTPIGYRESRPFSVPMFQTIFFILSMTSFYMAFFEPGLDYEGRTTDPDYLSTGKNWLIIFIRAGLIMVGLHGLILYKERSAWYPTMQETIVI